MKTTITKGILIILLVAGWSFSAIGQKDGVSVADSLFRLCQRCNDWIGMKYDNPLYTDSISGYALGKHYSRLTEELIRSYIEKKDSAVLAPPLRTFLTDVNEYLDAIEDVRMEQSGKIAPFVYNELRLLFAQLSISRNVLGSAISFLDTKQRMDTAIVRMAQLDSLIRHELDSVSKQMKYWHFQQMKATGQVDSNLLLVHNTVKKNEKRLKWLLGIGSVTLAAALATLVLVGVK